MYSVEVLEWVGCETWQVYSARGRPCLIAPTQNRPVTLVRVAIDVEKIIPGVLVQCESIPLFSSDITNDLHQGLYTFLTTRTTNRYDVSSLHRQNQMRWMLGSRRMELTWTTLRWILETVSIPSEWRSRGKGHDWSIVCFKLYGIRPTLSRSLTESWPAWAAGLPMS
jgi:hypothetical protein